MESNWYCNLYAGVLCSDERLESVSIDLKVAQFGLSGMLEGFYGIPFAA